MNNRLARYRGNPKTKYAYQNEFLVECPRCSKAARVSHDVPGGILTCSHCDHVRRAADEVRYEVLVKRSCDTCGQTLQKIIRDQKMPLEVLIVPCPHCGIARSYEPRNIPYRQISHATGPTDPLFGLPLWFQCTIRGRLFWAFNREHLDTIGNYVAATLRERAPCNYSTMVERLPTFIKVKQNRVPILNAIDKLLKK